MLFYARDHTQRAAVPLGMLGLDELARRRPGMQIGLFGMDLPLDASFAYEQLGVLSPGALALRYSEATVGICLSLTNYSLIPQEMMACVLPCVDLNGRSPEATLGQDDRPSWPNPIRWASRTPSRPCSTTGGCGNAVRTPAWPSSPTRP